MGWVGSMKDDPRTTLRYTAEISASSAVECGLTFWQDGHRQMSYPKLSPLALDHVPAPASQAYVERVFSVCGDLCARKRNRTSANLEQRRLHFSE